MSSLCILHQMFLVHLQRTNLQNSFSICFNTTFSAVTVAKVLKSCRGCLANDLYMNLPTQKPKIFGCLPPRLQTFYYVEIGRSPHLIRRQCGRTCLHLGSCIWKEEFSIIPIQKNTHFYKIFHCERGNATPRRS